MRTQIAFSPEQHARGKQKATELGITMAEYIRRLVDQDLATARVRADLTAITGLFNTGGSDIATERPHAIRAALRERADRTNGAFHTGKEVGLSFRVRDGGRRPGRRFSLA